MLNFDCLACVRDLLALGFKSGNVNRIGAAITQNWCGATCPYPDGPEGIAAARTPHPTKPGEFYPNFQKSGYEILHIISRGHGGQRQSQNTHTNKTKSKVNALAGCSL